MSSFETPTRVRINASETAQGFRLDCTAEGPTFIVNVSENDERDLARAVKTTLGAQLASYILQTRDEFKAKNIPLAIPDLKGFVEKKTEKLPHTISGKAKEKIK